MKELTKTLPASWYHDPKLFEQERKTVFGKEWLYAAETVDLKNSGDYVSFTLAGYPIFIMKGEDQTIRAFHNFCRHRAAPLVQESKGHMKMPSLTCKYHGWTYSLSGELLQAPFCSSEVCSKKNPDLSLVEIQVGEFNNKVFINLDRNAVPFSQAWAPILEEFKKSGYRAQEYVATGQMTKLGRFNWKVWMDGYQECYHCPTIHPILSKDFALRKYQIENKERYSIHSCERKGESALGTFQGLWLWVYPNLGLPCYEPCYYTLQVNPIDATHTELNYRFRFKESVDAQTREEFINLVKKITQEDVEICEGVQKNLLAGVYEDGYLNLERENGVAYFHSLLKNSVSQSF